MLPFQLLRDSPSPYFSFTTSFMSVLMMIPLLTDLNDLLWLDCLVARAALRVQELQQFLKCLGVGRVVQKSTLPLYVDEILRLSLSKWCDRVEFGMSSSS